jgi:integrase
MARRELNRLSATGVKSLKERGYYADGGGLYFRVSKFDTTSWAFRFTVAGKAREMGLGPFPDVSLREARERAAEARKLLRDGVDPIEQRRTASSEIAAARASALTFQQCAEAYIASKEAGWKNAKHGAQWSSTLGTYAYPVIGRILAREVALPHILRILEPIWATKTETAKRLRGRIEMVLDYAAVKGYRSGENPARWRGHLENILASPQKIAPVEHHAALPHQDIGEFMAELRSQAGTGARALEFAILTAGRSGEVRGATWSEIDMNGAVWTIPGARMKAGKEHRVPLSNAALNVLRQMESERQGALVFPGRTGKKPLSDMSLTAVLKRMNRSDLTAHGFRSTFRDWAGETTAYAREIIEHALAHQLKDKAEAAYARGTLFDKRRRLMDDWAKACATKKTAAQVVTIGKRRAAQKI